MLPAVEQTTLDPGLRRGDNEETSSAGLRRGDNEEAARAGQRRGGARALSSFRRRPESSVFLLLILASLAGCNRDSLPETAPFDLASVLGGDDTTGFLRADAPRAFTFPADHGPHVGFRNEWWYFTGNLDAEDGRRFGYQLTFFNSGLRPMQREPSSDSAWHSERLWMAHAALTDAEAGEHHASERFSRENPGLAGATLEPFRVWLDDWQLSGDANGPWRLQASDSDFALDLELRATKVPVLQGVDGLSQKSPEPGNASYYYSITRIATRGTVRAGAETFSVSGSSWLDREWSTSALAEDQSGWDWFSLQFDDGRELMYYQLRTTNGTAHPNSQGNWTSGDARQTLVTADDVMLMELDTWTSPAGVTYATEWSLEYGNERWRIDAVLDEQLMDLTIPYWEGAVDVFDENDERVGRGYLEMVRD